MTAERLAPLPIHVRKATEADLPEILRLYAQPAMDDGRVLTVDEAAKVFRRMSEYPSYAVYVAERGGRVVGTYALLIMDNLGHMGAPSGIVEDVCVDGAAQRQGIGRALLTFAMDTARRHGCYKLVLSSNSARERAHAFYRSLGFRSHGVSFHVDLFDETGAPVERSAGSTRP